MDALSLPFWQGRRVFLTGHTGFKGTWLAQWLVQLGAQVSGYALPPDPQAHRLYLESGLDAQLHSTLADLRDLPSLLQAVRRAQPEVVLHLAAQSLVRPSYQQPVETYAVNVMGTVHLLEAVRQTPGVQAVVVITTDKCYENQEWVWPYRETDRLGGHDPYSNSKACAELVTDAYRRSFLAAQGVLLASARAGNVIGGGDLAAERLLPDAIRAFHSGQPLELRHPGATRPWQHVLDPLHGYLLLAQGLGQGRTELARAFNFGPPDEHTVGEVVRRLVEAWGPGAQALTPPGPHPHEASRLHLDSRQAHQLLGWSPRLDFASGLQATLDFYRRWLDGADPGELMREQTAGFQPHPPTAQSQEEAPIDALRT